MALLARLMLRWFGWKGVVEVDIPLKCVICVAPHTSNWDFIIARIFYASLLGKPHFLMKKEWFFPPLNYLFKALGGIPVDRERKTRITEQMISEFNRRSLFHLAVTPEGTRKRTSNWKSGFYYIALGANVPIALAHIDYRRKEIGVSRLFYPTTGRDRQDIEEMKRFYSRFQARHPEQFDS